MSFTDDSGRNLDELIHRLETFGFVRMDEEGIITEFEVNPLTKSAADAIRYLRNELWHSRTGAILLEIEGLRQVIDAIRSLVNTVTTDN